MTNPWVHLYELRLEVEYLKVSWYLFVQFVYSENLGSVDRGDGLVTTEGKKQGREKNKRGLMNKIFIRYLGNMLNI